MDNLNNIPNVGNWGDAASKLNDNFNKIKQSLTTVENVSKNNKGYFTSLSALNTAFPSPKAGQTAYVHDEASSTNYYIYNAVNGAWVTSNIEAPSVGVDIAGYTKTGGSTKTTKEVEDEIVQSIRNISGNWFSIPGKYVRQETGNIADTPNDSIITDYLDITNVNKIIIKGRSTPLVALCAFYSENKTYISSIYGYDKDNKTVEITDIPSNAKYMIGSGYGLGDDFLIISTAKSLGEDIQNLDESLSEDIQDLKNSIAEDKSIIINLDSTITEDGYWRLYPDGRRNIHDYDDTYKHNTPVAVQLGDEFTTSSSIVSGAESISFHAMLDEDMNIIGALVTADGYKITQDLIDAGVRYISFSYRPTDTPKTLTLIRVVDISGMYTKISKNESDIETLHSRVAQLEDETPYISGIAAMGASLMYPGNVWFVDAANSLKIIPYNKAESGVGTPSYFADKLWRGTYCTNEEFEDMDILAIQFASSRYLERTNDLLPTADDYTDSFDVGDPSNQFETTYSPHQQLDYILKFWQKWCYDQKDNPSSKWYGVQHGKPFRVIFVTHWHDARPYYNDAIRIVAERWGCGVCEFDKKIGFSKNQPLPDLTQVSVLYAEDTQEIGGVTYGWHPKRGLHSEYIQGKMAFIFADTIKEYFGLL